ncbi:tryptophan synthase subunit beta [Candidatus Gracilibacteria bacterium]|nr:tryptophan synthase subunit beta [Candidatus Gracilibacteria bacterium]MCF7856299.1 tryptophan synthase subunit beta [Candidatus Gracilibacteria bacterium]
MNKRGYFGEFGGAFVPEVLRPALTELEKVWTVAKKDKKFWVEFHDLAKNYSGRPTPLTFCENISKKLGGAKIYLKREDLNQTGAHKINNVLGQALLAKRLGKTRLIAETGAGQHGVATATIAAKFGFECTIFMGAVDVARQRPNVFWMEKLGAKVVPVKSGTRRLKDAVAEALRDWAANVDSTHYLLGSALGPHPFPEIVRDFQKVIGEEVRREFIQRFKKLPDYLVACVGGGSNAIGLFHSFLRDKKVQLIGVEAGGRSSRLGNHASRISIKPHAPTGIFEGFFGEFLQDPIGNLAETHSVAAGLDHPGVGPEHSALAKTGRVKYFAVRDSEVIATAQLLMREEGIIPALESAHALAYAFKIAPRLKGKNIVINLSGRGDKDIFIYARTLRDKKWKEFLRKEFQTL